MISTSTAVEHGITIDVVRLPAGSPFTASCLCGGKSRIVPSRPKAIEAGEQHITGPIECATWCAYGDGHPNVWAREDQICYGTELAVELTVMPVVPDEGGWRAHKVFAGRRPGMAAEVLLQDNDEPELHLTPDEARQLIEHVQLVLGQIEGAR